MSLSRIDLNLFVVFDTIYTEKNLTRAAEVLHITQPAVSNSLSRLRDVFDDPLFVRQGKQMVPTPLAENIHERVRRGLLQFSSSINEHDRFDPLTSTRTFSFAMNDTSEFYLLPRLVNKLREVAPHICIESFALAREELTKEFASGRLDFALDVPLISEAQLIHKSIRQDRFVVATRPGHPRLKDGLSFELYLSLPHLHVSSRRGGQGIIDVELNRRGLKRHIQMRVQHARAAPSIVSNTDFVLTMPESMVRGLNLDIFELPFTVPPLDWHLYWSSNYDGDKGHAWMRETIFNLIKTSNEAYL